MTASCYITFPTTFFAIRAESILKKQSCSYKMVPVPRVISSSCGTALRCECDNIEEIKFILLENNVELEGFYKLKEEGLKTPVIIPLAIDDWEAGEK